MHLYGKRAKSQELALHLERLSRRMLYKKIKDYEPRVEEMRKHKFAQLKKEYDRNFQDIVLDILNDETAWKTEFEDVADEDEDRKATKDAGACDELGLILATLKDIDNDSVTDWSEQDREIIQELSTQLMVTSQPSTIKLQMDNGTVEIPAIDNEVYEKKLLRESCSNKVLQELDADDVTNAVSCPDAKRANSRNVDQSYSGVGSNHEFKIPFPPLPHLMKRLRAPPHLTFHDYVVNTSAYRDESGEENCCELDSPSCMLTTALVTDRLEQQQKVNSKQIMGSIQHQ